MARHSNNPKRRIAPQGQFTSKQLEKLVATMTYEGSGHHKRRPVDYGFSSVNPRPWKSLCDRERGISIDEAKELFENGIRRGMVSAFFKDERPKYVWAVDSAGVPYEAKIGTDSYHGYPLEQDDDMYETVRGEWAKR